MLYNTYKIVLYILGKERKLFHKSNLKNNYTPEVSLNAGKKKTILEFKPDINFYTIF